MNQAQKEYKAFQSRQRLLRKLSSWHHCDEFTFEQFAQDISGEKTKYGSVVWTTYYSAAECEEAAVCWSDLKRENTSDPNRQLYLVCQYLCAGDYDNSCDVERANYREFMQECSTTDEDGCKSLREEFEGIVYELYGAYTECGIALAIPQLFRFPELVEIIDGLKDYPIINEDSLWEIQQELQQQAWHNYLDYEFARMCENLFDCEIDNQDLLQDAFWAAVYRAENAGDIEWYYESGSAGIYRMEESLAEHIDPFDLFAAIGHSGEQVAWESLLLCSWFITPQNKEDSMLGLECCFVLLVLFLVALGQSMSAAIGGPSKRGRNESDDE